MIDGRVMDDSTTIVNPFEDQPPKPVPAYQSDYDFHPATSHSFWIIVIQIIIICTELSYSKVC